MEGNQICVAASILCLRWVLRQADIDAHPGLVLVGHDMGQDLDLLAKWGVRVPEGAHSCMRAALPCGTPVLCARRDVKIRAYPSLQHSY